MTTNEGQVIFNHRYQENESLPVRLECAEGDSTLLSQQLDMLWMLDQASHKAKQLSTPILVSQCHRIVDRDLLFFFEKGAHLFAGERIYWSNPNQSIEMVGLGTAYSFKQYIGNHYQFVERGWQELLENGLLDVESSIPGTGPTLIGGFSFDPLKPKTRLWHQFSDTMMTLPKFLVTSVDGQTWLTMNRVIHADDDVYREKKRLEKEQKELLTNQDHSFPLSMKTIPPLKDRCELHPGEWQEAVTQITRDIRQGKVQKVVLARELQLFWDDVISPSTVLYRLREEQPSSYIFAVEAGEHCFVGASPERLVKREGNRMYSTSMAGSTPRGNTPKEDAQLSEQLLQDRKNLVEHQIVVDMIEQAMREVCTHVYTPSTPRLFKAKDIQHLYTPVQGTVQERVSLLSMVEQLSPTPALGGFPRGEALERIRQLEKMDRGWYAAPVGWLAHQGDGEFAIAIRSALLQGDRASLFAGCGIVEESKAAHEYEETRVKFRPMLSALGGLDS